MAYAAWTKGSGALLLTVHALAQAEGVGDALAAEWARSLPGLSDRVPGTEQAAAAKGWRWVGEMEEIAASMDAVGLPAGFHEAAAELYDRAAGGAPRERPGNGHPPTLDAILSALM